MHEYCFDEYALRWIDHDERRVELFVNLRKRTLR